MSLSLFNRKLYKRLENQNDNDVRELSEEGFTFLAKRYKSTQDHKVETQCFLAGLNFGEPKTQCTVLPDQTGQIKIIDNMILKAKST